MELFFFNVHQNLKNLQQAVFLDLREINLISAYMVSSKKSLFTSVLVKATEKASIGHED